MSEQSHNNLYSVHGSTNVGKKDHNRWGGVNYCAFLSVKPLNRVFDVRVLKTWLINAPNDHTQLGSCSRSRIFTAPLIQCGSGSVNSLLVCCSCSTRLLGPIPLRCRHALVTPRERQMVQLLDWIRLRRAEVKSRGQPRSPAAARKELDDHQVRPGADWRWHYRCVVCMLAQAFCDESCL